MSITIAFLNCHNLFEVGAHRSRGPKTGRSFERKVADIALTLRKASANHAPDLVALSEMGSEQVGREVAEAIESDGYDIEWSGIPKSLRPSEPEPGLAILYKSLRLSRTGAAAIRDRPNMGGRHRWMASEFQVGPSPTQAFWVVVNHWTSDYRRKFNAAEELRLISAIEIGELFLKRIMTPSAEAVILVGDFNCEPFSRAFTGRPRTGRLVGARERSIVLRDGNNLMYAYNPMWRRLGEPDDLEQAALPGYFPSRPLGTYVSNKIQQTGWRTLDQVLVSKRMLSFGPLQLREGSITVQPPVRSCSDHHAVSAIFA